MLKFEFYNAIIFFIPFILIGFFYFIKGKHIIMRLLDMVDDSIREFQNRERRFGKISEQVKISND